MTEVRNYLKLTHNFVAIAPKYTPEISHCFGFTTCLPFVQIWGDITPWDPLVTVLSQQEVRGFPDVDCSSFPSWGLKAV